MFDIGFSEMMVIAVVALIVIGPERLPKVARTLGLLLGRLQRYVNDVKADVNRELELSELKKFKDQFQETAQSVEQTIRNETIQTEADIQSTAVAAVEAAAGIADGASTGTPDETALVAGIDPAGSPALPVSDAPAARNPPA